MKDRRARALLFSSALQRLSLRWQLVLSYLALALLVLAFTGSLALGLVEHYAQQREVDYLRTRAEMVAQQAAPLLALEPQLEALAALAGNTSFLEEVQVQIYDAQGEILIDSGPPVERITIWTVGPHGEKSTTMVLSEYPGQVQLVTGVTRQSITEGLPISTSTTPLPEVQVHTLGPRSDSFVRLPIDGPDGLLGFVEVNNGPAQARAAVETAREALFYAALAAIGVALLAGLVFGGHLSAPLRQLAATAAQVGAGDLAVRAPEQGHGEIREVTKNLNRMAEQLQASFAELASERDALRRFIGDASHELRTPITALKTFNELLQGPAAGDPAAQAEFLAESQLQLERLEWIVQNLLDLSRLEAGLSALEIAPHDVGEILTAAVGAVQRRAQERDIRLLRHLPDPPLVLPCDRMRLEIALANLLDNASKFTPPGGTVEVGAEPAPGAVRLWVQDNGPGIPAADLPHLFERFYGGGGRQAPGNGLGLAIVRGIARAHGGTVSVVSEEGQGSRFTLEIPQCSGQDGPL